MTQRRYKVVGEDEEGDIHVFHTDDHERAEGVLELMREDLESVELVKHE